jgi:hypothetical protein
MWPWLKYLKYAGSMTWRGKTLYTTFLILFIAIFYV